MVKPITPEEVGPKEIPDFVISAVNDLIRQEYRNDYACFRQSQLISQIRKVQGDLPLESWWLGFEPLYEAAGWEVGYDQPGYNETYPATSTFRKKK